MASVPPNPTNLTPPRVPFIDERSGAISREWYRFFLSLLTATETNAQDINSAPDVNALLATYDAMLNAVVQDTQSQPDSSAAVASLESELNSLANTALTEPRQELGTMAALQQANVPWLKFNTAPQGFPTGALANGTLYWNEADNAKTLNLVMEDTGGVIQQIGEETYYRVKATAPITDGQVVMFTGTLGASGGLKAAPATGLSPTQSELIMGVATQNIPLNSWGYVTWFGKVRGIDTTGGAEVWANGDVLYYNPTVPGGLTKNIPVAPNPKVIVASVVHAASNGILFVRPTFGSALGATDSNVQITSLTNGDILQYDGVDLRWENRAPSTVTVGTATNLAGGLANQIAYQTAPGTTGFATVGTGLLLSGGTLSNAAPDQTVSITASTGISVTGTYPNFTITNTAPDKTVVLTGAGTTVVSGTYPNFTITSNDQYVGTVTSVNISGGTTGLSFSGGPITTSGTITTAGTLNVANGGTGTATAFTAGSVVFAGASGIYAQDNSNLFWDDANNRLGIGTNVPAAPFHAKSTGQIAQLQSTNNDAYLLIRETGADAVFGSYNGVGFAGTSSNNDFELRTNNVQQALVTPAGLFKFNSGYGSVQTAYGCRAWVNFNGTGTVSIRASGNVSSITDNGTGDYTINLTNALPDTNYCITSWLRNDIVSNTACYGVTANSTDTKTTSAMRISTRYATSGAANVYDSPEIGIAFFR